MKCRISGIINYIVTGYRHVPLYFIFLMPTQWLKYSVCLHHYFGVSWAVTQFITISNTVHITRLNVLVQHNY